MPVLDEDTVNLLEYRQLCNHPKYAKIWNQSFTNKMGHLCQVVGKGIDGEVQRIKGTDTFFMVDYEDIPRNQRKEITYTSVVCTVLPQKEDPNCTRITICGNLFYYPVDMGTPTASLELFKLIINSVLSKRGTQYATFDIKNIYLGTLLNQTEYVKIRLANIPQEFIEEYDLET